jgi:hypothetical protein
LALQPIVSSSTSTPRQVESAIVLKYKNQSPGCASFPNSEEGIAIGSSVQIALLVARVLVFASLFIGPVPLDLAFPAGIVLMVFLSALSACGKSPATDDPTGSKGAQLLAVYLILGLTYFLVPIAPPH